MERQQKILEAVLFAAGEAVPVAKLAESIETELESALEAVRGLAETYRQSDRGLRIIEINDTFQMTTNPEYYPYVQRMILGPPERTLSQTLLETLAIIAYKQPVTKSQIEEIRGVNADHAVNKLMEYGLIVEKGRLDAAGRPIIFGTSDDFLKHFGFQNVGQLPTL